MTLTHQAAFVHGLLQQQAGDSVWPADPSLQLVPCHAWVSSEVQVCQPAWWAHVAQQSTIGLCPGHVRVLVRVYPEREALP